MAWSINDLENALAKLREHGGETVNVEVKKAHQGYPENLAPTLSAFSNMPGGGTIIFGIDEAKNFLPVGVYDANLLEQAITSTLRNSLEPKGNAEFSRLKLAGKTILIAEVPALPAHRRPCYTAGKAYMRYSEGDYAMDDYEISRIVSLRERERYDILPVTGSTIDDLDSAYIENFVQEVKGSSRRLAQEDSPTILLRKNVLSMADGEPTLGGVYALGRYPQQFFPSLKVTGVVEDPSGKSRNLDKLETDGPLPELLANTLQWVRQNLRHEVAADALGGLVDVYDVPLVAVREIIANALVHRDLSPDVRASKDVHIRIKPDKIIVTNPGGLWGVTLENLSTPGHKTAVNDVLYEICKLIKTPTGERVIEGEGGGVYEAQQAYRRAELAPIEFIDRGFQFTAILPRAQYRTGGTSQPFKVEAGVIARVSANERLILDYLGKTPGQSVGNLAELTSLSIRQVRYALGRLEEEGLVRRQQKAGTRAYLYAVTPGARQMTR